MSRPPRYHRLAVAFLAAFPVACTGGPVETPLSAPSPAASPARSSASAAALPATPTASPLERSATGLASSAPSPSPSPANVPAPRLVNGRYTVQAGDNLSRIAALFSTTVEEIVAANRLANPNAIAAGDRLIIPGASPSPAPSPSR